MKCFKILIVLLLFTGNIFAQTENLDTTVYTIVEKRPIFDPINCCEFTEESDIEKCSDRNFLKALSSHFNLLDKNSYCSSSYIKFIVNEQGKMEEFSVLIMEGDKKKCADSFFKIFLEINKHYSWKPAENNKKQVKVRMTLPVKINFNSKL
jgi:hypothetical protein